MNKRIQRQRTKGWRMPEGAIYVGRPSRWGNPYIAWPDRRPEAPVKAFREDMRDREASDSAAFARWLEPLRGRDLACWCPLDQPCHADVLLELANRSEHDQRDHGDKGRAWRMGLGRWNR